MTGRKLLILDLDETLIYATESALRHTAAFVVGPYHVYLRPHLQDFLALSRSHFDIAVWTASTADYASAIVKNLSELGLEPRFTWSRDRCTLRFDPEGQEHYFVKDLKKVRRLGYPLEQVLVIDDTARKHERNFGNLVSVAPFEGDPADDELSHLGAYLQTLAGAANVRSIEKRGWRSLLTADRAR